ncbi:heavy metal efflux pump, CzcA family [Verrucomicrobiia bacterium DG1235]|nr:heavy metal efflux pump, CzcA family [Verrucomicrobiae bacterium DG1235]
MLNRLIQFSLGHRTLVLAAAIAILALGLQTARDLPVEVLPDLTKPTVTILTEAPGLAPEEVETLVTVPLESALMGVAGVTRLRTTSDVSLSLTFVEFEWGTDIYLARQFVQERLQVARESLPDGIQPYMTPVASLMGEIMLVGIHSEDQSVAPSDLRTLADWTVARRLQSIPGVAEVLAMGGGIKQLQVQPDPNRMLALGITFDELRHAASQAARNTTGGFLTNAPQEIMVRHLAMSTDTGALGSTVVKLVEDRPIRISDVATLVWDVEPMRGDAAVDSSPGVILSVTKAPGFDTLALTEKVETALAELQPTMPDSVRLVPLFRQADFIEHAVGNLQEAIRDGAIMVTIVLFLFLLNLRTTFITLTAIPLSFAITLLVFRWFGISVNSMTLGGLAVAIGMVVDDAIVDVENVFRRLRENAVSNSPRPKLEVIASASAEVRNSILYATLFIILVFLPLLGLSGVEGRLFTPIAIATIVSMVASFIVSLTVIPVLCSLLLKPSTPTHAQDPAIVRLLKSVFKNTWLQLALSQPFLVLALAALLLAGALSLYPRMGKDFLPSFNEETALIALTAAPGTSLQKTNEISAVAEALILSVPEVRVVGRRVGRAERGDHVVPVSTVEFDIDFHKDLPDSRPRAVVLEEIRQKIRGIPGTFAALSGPLADRIGHMLSGVSAKVAIKVYGKDLNEIRRIGTEIQDIAHSIPGLEAARVEQQAPIPQLRVEIDRDRALAYGITPGSLNDQLASLIGGETVAELYEGQRTIDLVLRLPEAWRENPKQLEQLYVDTANGGRIPLSFVANIREARGPNVIQRENTLRRFVVSINPTSRDLTGLVTQLRDRVTSEIALPQSYFISFEGEFQAQQEATRRIAWLSLLALCVIATLLFTYFKTPVFTIQVLADIPLALIGGLALTSLLLNNISIATLVGFIAVAGVAARNSVMMISHYLHLMRHEGEGFTREMIERGTLERLVPVLMTALSAGIALIPLVLAANQPGKEILHPVAVVIVGGLVTSTFLGLGVTPAIFYTFGRKAAKKAVEQKAAASD